MADCAAEMDGVNNHVKTPDNTVKLSEQLRAERIKLFGKHEGKRNITVKDADAYKQALHIPDRMKFTAEPWPYILQLANYIERQTGKPLPTLYKRPKPPNSHYATAFVVILRYGFNLQRRLIYEYVGIQKTHCNYLLDNYRENGIYSPEFNDILQECLEHLETIQ